MKWIAFVIAFSAACGKATDTSRAAGANGSNVTRIESHPTVSPIPDPVPPPSLPTPAERWHPFTQKDKMDDSVVVGVKLLADDDVRTMYGQAYRPRLVIGCQKDTTDAYVDVGTLLTTETRQWESDEAYGWKSGVPLRLRLDKDPPMSNFASQSTDGTAAYLSNPTAILKKMISHTTLLVEYTPMGAAPQTVTFTLTGMGDAIAELRKSCHW